MEPADNKNFIAQDLRKEGKFSGVLPVSLLFHEPCELPATDILLEKLKEKFGHVDVVAKSSLSSFALTDHCVTYKDGKKAPPQVMISQLNPVKESLGDTIVRSQFWDCPNGVELLDSCPWQVMICDFMDAGLPVLERTNILADLLEVALELFPTCTAVFSHLSGKLLTMEDARKNPYSGPVRYFHFGVNARLFNVQGGGGESEMIVDTLGLYVLGIPDMQYHFRDLDPNAVVNHAYNTAIYQFENDSPIESGHTIDGFEPGSRWKCQYEHSLVQPVRHVLDVSIGDFAAGGR